jgi:hypothetical protein
MTRIATIPAANPVSGMLVNGKFIYLFGTANSSNGTDGFLRATDGNGVPKWTLVLDNGSTEIATAAARDASGNIWVVGSATKIALGTTTPTPSPTDTSTVTIVNPDAVSPDAVVPIRKDLTTVIMWKVSSAGTLLATYSSDLAHPILVRGVAISSQGIAVVGMISTSSGNAGFLLQADPKGTFGKPLLIGKSDSVANTLVKKSDGSLVVMGSSAESIGGKVLIGAQDGLIASISSAGKLTSLTRSSNAKSARSWQSTTNSLFLGGDATLNGRTEAVVTKFAANLVPSWTVRFPAMSPALTFDISTTSRSMTFASIGPIKGVTGWKPRRIQVLTLILDRKGAPTEAFGAPAMTTPISMGYSRDLGVVVLGAGVLGVSIFHALPR